MGRRVSKKVFQPPRVVQVRAKGGPPKAAAVPKKVAGSIRALRGGGKPLSKSAKAFFEPRLGQDFSKVRLHTDARAAEAASAIKARAFTLGNDIAFAKGAFQPETTSGKKLLAHELTHAKTNDRNNVVRRLKDPLVDMTTFQSPGSSGWRGAIWGCFRSNCTKKHKGWDINATVGTECKAVVKGTTVHQSQGSSGYGDYVVLTSNEDSNKKYIYAHLGTREPAGTFEEGAKIGTVGTSGNASSTRPHLHFTVKESGSKVDPDGKGFSKPTKVIEETGSTATTINESDPSPCTECDM